LVHFGGGGGLFIFFFFCGFSSHVLIASWVRLQMQLTSAMAMAS
jgi:hypothetical protein